jgi:hypothetical protein
MNVVTITKNARLKKDGDGLFWLIIESSHGSVMFNLSNIEVNPITHEQRSLGSEDVLNAFMEAQKTPTIDSPN